MSTSQARLESAPRLQLQQHPVLSQPPHLPFGQQTLLALPSKTSRIQPILTSPSRQPCVSQHLLPGPAQWPPPWSLLLPLTPQAFHTTQPEGWFEKCYDVTSVLKPSSNFSLKYLSEERKKNE